MSTDESFSYNVLEAAWSATLLPKIPPSTPALHADCSTGVAPRRESQICLSYTDVRSMLMVLWHFKGTRMSQGYPFQTGARMGSSAAVCGTPPRLYVAGGEVYNASTSAPDGEQFQVIASLYVYC